MLSRINRNKREIKEIEDVEKVLPDLRHIIENPLFIETMNSLNDKLSNGEISLNDAERIFFTELSKMGLDVYIERINSFFDDEVIKQEAVLVLKWR